ncbi:HET-domain-containing protein, partial [Colletotrichum sublineola]
STRLITLYANKDTPSPLSCKLIEIDIDDPPVYQALSYTWDDEIPSEPMTVRDDDNANIRSQTLLIGLWVDAVCINQSSTTEKSVQVAMMATIYRNARDVLVWLGEKW